MLLQSQLAVISYVLSHIYDVLVFCSNKLRSSPSFNIVLELLNLGCYQKMESLPLVCDVPGFDTMLSSVSSGGISPIF